MKLLTLCFLLVGSWCWADDFRPASLTLQPSLEGSVENMYNVVWKRPIKDRRLPQLNIHFDEQVKNYFPKRARTLDGTHIETWQISREKGVSGLEINVEGLEGSSYEVILRVPARDQSGNSFTKILNTDTPSIVLPDAHVLALSLIHI